MSIEIANESGYAVDEAGLLALARHALDEMGVNPMAELSLLLVDLAYMAELNHRWMDSSGPTDVLAFPMDELDVDRGPGVSDDTPEPSLLGDVVLCPAVAERQARGAGHRTEDELHLLTVHGILHLLGYDHAEPDEEKEMFALQATLIRSFRTAQAAARVER
ncbi:MAG TPA: rRNA maturation RNase YbeY [Cryptosporangiaceae bacterium]|nr:rRNA maturation RNase YbeY [Cryptosporangiaceae bacterium]